MDTILNIHISESLLLTYGFKQHPSFEYWFYQNGSEKEVYRLERKEDGVWSAFLPCYFFPILRELTTLGELSNLHQGFFDKPLVL